MTYSNEKQIDNAITQMLANGLPIKIDRTYHKGHSVDDLRFEKNAKQKWCLPIKFWRDNEPKLREIAILGWDKHSQGEGEMNYICFRIFPVIPEEALATPDLVGFLVTDRSSSWLYKSFEKAKEIYLERLRTLNNPFGEMSHNEVNMRALHYDKE